MEKLIQHLPLNSRLISKLLRHPTQKHHHINPHIIKRRQRQSLTVIFIGLEIINVVVLAFGFQSGDELVEKGAGVELGVEERLETGKDGLDVVVVGEAVFEGLDSEVRGLESGVGLFDWLVWTGFLFMSLFHWFSI